MQRTHDGRAARSRERGAALLIAIGAAVTLAALAAGAVRDGRGAAQAAAAAVGAAQRLRGRVGLAP